MDELTRKQKGFVKDYVETGNGTQAALNHYDTKEPTVAASIASENLTKPYIQKAIADALPDELLERVHLEGLQASKEVWKNNNESGEIEKVSEEPDYAVRHKYLDSAYKIKGTYAPEKKDVRVEGVIVTDAKKLEIAQKYEKEIKEGL